jgi:hypothetical protein
MSKYEVEKIFFAVFSGWNITAVMKNYGQKYSDRNEKNTRIDPWPTTTQATA